MTYDSMTRGAAFALMLTACGPPLVGVEPRISGAQRDALQRSVPRPPVEAKEEYDAVAQETDIPVPLAVLSAWLQRSEIRSLQAFSKSTAEVARISQAQDLAGTWSRAGDRRRVVFADGNSAVQELVYVRPEGLEYVEWNLTNRAGRYLRHVVHQLELSPNGSSTRVRWTSAFRPRPFPDGLLIRSYVHDDYGEYLRGTLSAMRQRAIDDLATAPQSTSNR